MWWLVLIFQIFGTFAENLSNEYWLNQTKSTSVSSARASKYDWTGVLDNPECPGNVLTLNPGEATRIKSHKNYGKSEYPENYTVSPLDASINYVNKQGGGIAQMATILHKHIYT